MFTVAVSQTVVNGRANGRSMALVLLENGLDLDLSLTAKV